MTGSATPSGQETSQPAGESGAAAAAGDQSATTVLGGEPAKPGEAAKPGETPAAAAKPGEAAKPAEGAAKAPDTYAAFTMPEGVEVDAKALESFTPALRELNLSQDQAQKLVDVYAKNQADQATAYMEQLKDDKFALGQVGQVLGHQRETWSKALKADAEIGGKNFDANVQTAQRAIARFGSPELKATLEATGLGNHPEFVRFCLKVGHLVTEDKTALGAGAGSGQRKPDADVFYGNQAG